MYNVEIFDNEYNFVDSAQIEECGYKFDYLALEPTVITTEIINCSRGNYISILNVDSDEKYWGYIAAIEVNEETQDISFYPIMKKLDVVVHWDRTDLADMTCERFLQRLIAACYVNNTDSEQNIAGLEVVVESSTPNASLNLKDDTHNIYDIAVRSLKKYYIQLSFDVQIKNKRIVCTIRKATETRRTIEADLSNIIEPAFTFKDTYEMVNKIYLYGSYPESSEQYGTTVSTVYYLQPDGAVVKMPTSRIKPVVWKVNEFIIQDDFEKEAYDSAYEILYREELDNNIEFKVAQDDALVSISQYEVGQKANIIKDATVYSTVFTGYEIGTDGTVKLIFGAIRTEYTKVLRMERS